MSRLLFGLLTIFVLSACNTSLGNIKEGEGVFSLARGFFYSGANSVVSSLWNVNDKSTSQIISSFYENLEKGKSKSSALRLAKTLSQKDVFESCVVLPLSGLEYRS